MSLPFRGGWPFRNPPNTQFTVNRNSPQAEGLVGWWPTVGQAGVVLRDYSQRNHNGAKSGSVTLAHDTTLGSVFYYEGSNDYYSISDHDDLSANPELSVSAWVNQENAGAERCVIGKAHPVDGQYEWALHLNSGYVRFSTWTLAGNTHLYATSSGVELTAGRFHLCTACVNVDTPSLSVYVDGRLVATDTSTQSTPYANGTGNVRIGERGDGGQDYIGYIGPVRLANRMWSAAEVYALYDPATRWELYQPVPRVFVVAKAPAAVEGQPMMLRGTTVPHMARQWHPRVA